MWEIVVYMADPLLATRSRVSRAGGQLEIGAATMLVLRCRYLSRKPVVVGGGDGGIDGHEQHRNGGPAPAGTALHPAHRLDQRPARHRVRQRPVPPVLPVQPGRHGVGRGDHLGPRHVPDLVLVVRAAGCADARARRGALRVRRGWPVAAPFYTRIGPAIRPSARSSAPLAPRDLRAAGAGIRPGGDRQPPEGVVELPGPDGVPGRRRLADGGRRAAGRRPGRPAAVPVRRPDHVVVRRRSGGRGRPLDVGVPAAVPAGRHLGTDRVGDARRRGRGRGVRTRRLRRDPVHRPHLGPVRARRPCTPPPRSPTRTGAGA